MPSPLFAVGVLLLASAACLAKPHGPPTASPHAGPVTYPWGLSGCSFAIVEVPVDPDRLAARLPPGFVARAGTGVVPGSTAPTISMDAYRCADAAGSDGPLRDVSYGSYYVAVDPPATLREPGYDAYFVKWDPVIPDEARRADLRAQGLVSHDGVATVAVPGGGAAGQVTARIVPSDGGGFRLTGAVQTAAAQAKPLPFMEFTPLEAGAGLARWHARLHDALIGAGVGTVELLPGSWVRDVVGSDRTSATFIAGEWNLDEADVTLPLPWPS